MNLKINKGGNLNGFRRFNGTKHNSISIGNSWQCNIHNNDVASANLGRVPFQKQTNPKPNLASCLLFYNQLSVEQVNGGFKDERKNKI